MIDRKIKANIDCMGCYACENVCPTETITMQDDKEGFWYPNVDYNNCIKCGKCIEVCPIINKIELVENKPIAYACFNNNEGIRLDSSSGGVFTLVAEEILNNKGLVFGVGFDDDFNIVHSYVLDRTDLFKFRGSKYVQSRVGKSYKQVKDYLNRGSKVLFTGTPCQISGLKSYLGKEYECLFTMDNICHGVPSPKVWQKYLEFREKKSGSLTQRISFRLKNEGWKRFSVLFLFQNNTEYLENLNKDLFMKAFLKDVCLRPSCYQCEFKSIYRASDITLADYWGIEDIHPEIYDDKGTSLIMINSEKGQKMFDMIKNKMTYVETDLEKAIKYNPSAVKSVEINPNREDFFDDLDNLNFDDLVKKYCTDKLHIRIKNKVKSIIIKVLKVLGLLDIIKKFADR